MRLRLLAVALAALAALSACGDDGSAEANDEETTLEFTYEIDEPCVLVGESQKITVKTEPKANVAYAISYPDRQARGTAPNGYADDDGLFVATWKIPDDAPPGQARVTLLAALGRKTGNEVVTFEIGNPAAPCA